MPRQFLKCRFHQGDARTYTYHNDGAPVARGDTVRVSDWRSDGWKRVEVVAITDRPDFATKPILGLFEEENGGAA